MPLVVIGIAATLIVAQFAANNSSYAKTARNLARIGWIIFFILIAIEQSFLLLYLNNSAIHQDKAFAHYLHSLHNARWTPNDVGLRAFDCKYENIAVIYDFRMCVYYIQKDRKSGRARYVLRIQKPGGYLSLIPRHLPNRMLWDGVDVFYFDTNGKVTVDLRENRW